MREKFMHYVYILQSEKDKKLYIGYTRDVKNRLKKHKEGFVFATKNRRPINLIYFEGYISMRDTKRREQFLKGGAGREQLKVQIENTFDKIDYPFRAL